MIQEIKEIIDRLQTRLLTSVEPDKIDLHNRLNGRRKELLMMMKCENCTTTFSLYCLGVMNEGTDNRSHKFSRSQRLSKPYDINSSTELLSNIKLFKHEVSKQYYQAIVLSQNRGLV